MNFTGPHSPMDVTQRMQDAWKDVGFPPPIGNDQAEYTPEDHPRNRRHDAAMIENIDRHIGRFLDVVRQRGETERTLVVFSSDHGEMLGDHGLWGKGSWYDASTRIPLIVAGPGVAQGVEREALVRLHDLTATFLEVAGADPLPAMDSRSLCGVLGSSRTAHRQQVSSALGGWRMVFDGRYKRVVRRGKPDLLYDTRHDPNEMRDIAGQAEAAGEAARPR